MSYLNIHTHTPAHEGEQTIPSAGLHPWEVTETWEEKYTVIFQSLNLSTFQLIGECGLDRVCATSYPLQLAAFEAQIRLSERLGFPLLLHCVRALDDVLRLKRGTCQPWIFHGFRGKPQQLQQLLDHGFYVSFGFRHNPESLRLCPPNRLFLETDTIPSPIVPLYVTAAQILGMTSEDLRRQVWENITRLGGVISL